MEDIYSRSPLFVDEDDDWINDNLSAFDPTDLEDERDFDGLQFKEEETLDFRATLRQQHPQIETWSEPQLDYFFSESISTH